MDRELFIQHLNQHGVTLNMLHHFYLTRPEKPVENISLVEFEFMFNNWLNKLVTQMSLSKDSDSFQPEVTIMQAKSYIRDKVITTLSKEFNVRFKVLTLAGDLITHI